MTKDKWIVIKTKHYNRKAMFHISCNGKSVAGRIFNEANAKRICQAVNSFPDLLKACQSMENHFKYAINDESDKIAYHQLVSAIFKAEQEL